MDSLYHELPPLIALAGFCMTPIEFDIRDFCEDDLARIVDITVEAFDGVSIDQNIEQRLGKCAEVPWKLRKEQAIQLDAKRDPGGIFVAQQGDEIIGYVTTWVDQNTNTGFIPNLAVAAECRGMGVGRALLEYALRCFRKRKLRLARIETLDQNEVGQELYPSLGFVEVARQIHYAMRLGEELD